MFNEKLKELRKAKGFTQETLAIQLHVVRQTVSKWEKGLSVPDADMLQTIAEVLEVSVSELLGADAPEETGSRNEVAEQLARINEQLAVSNRRSRRIWRVVAAVLLAVIAIPVLLGVAAVVNYGVVDREAAGKTEWTCTLQGESYVYGIEYDENYQVITAGGDAYISDHADIEDYSDANQVAAHLKDYVESKGGSVAVAATEGLQLNE